MNNATHTPGPWKATVRTVVNADDPLFTIDSQDANGELISHVASLGDGMSYYSDHAANAALIAAAPDLLAALRDAIDIINANCAPRIGAAARAAIARAEGKS